MKILLVLGKYLPDKNGGIENYCHSLSKLLFREQHGVEIGILESTQKEVYYFEGIKVIPLLAGLADFISLLKNCHYDICHFHEYSAFGGIEMPWFKEANKYCGKVYFTFHLPYFTCYKNDFRFKGIEDCKQFNSAERCLQCVVSTKMNYNGKKSAAFLYNIYVDVTTQILTKSGLTYKLKKRIRNNEHLLPELINVCDKVFLVAEWFKEILVTNGCNSPNFFLIPPLPVYSESDQAFFTSTVKKKILFVGRIEYYKGLHLLCKAMNNLSYNELILDVFGNIVDERYFETCQKEFPFNFKGAVPKNELLSKLNDYDFLVLPSVFTEMYPLVIQEAIAAHLPVIASAAKGNVDVIKEGKNGFIFDYDNSNDLALVIDKAYSMKKNGWQPQFDTTGSHVNNLKEILSYYS